MKWLDRFCFKYERFGIRNLMKYVVGLNALVFVLYLVNPTIYAWLMFDRASVLSGQLWRIITFAFLPQTTSVIFIIFVLYFYYMIGQTLESEWGSMKLTVYYVISILLTLAVCFIFNVPGSGTYINLSLFFAFATLYPDFPIRLFFLLPLKIKYLAYVDAAFFLYQIIATPFPRNLVPVGALGAYFLFFSGQLIGLVRRSRAGNARTVKFKSAVRKAKQEKGYIHKCAKCGLTDADDPEMEFRYCSLCMGYQCYCARHIFDHEHI